MSTHAAARLRAAAVCVAAAALAACGDRRAALPNPTYTAPRESTTAGVRHVHNTAARERLVLHERGIRDAALLFFGRAPAGRAAGLSWIAGGGRLTGLDGALRPASTLTVAELNNPVSVAAFDSLLVVSEAQGGITAVRLRSGATPDAVAIDSFTLSPWGAALPGDRVLVLRSPYFLPYMVEFPPAPLFTLAERRGRRLGQWGELDTPTNPALLQIVNAGTAAADSAGAVYFAPLARDEIRKYAPDGRLLWVADRALPLGREPVFSYRPGVGPSDTHVNVNFAVTTGPDGLLYVLSAGDSTGATLRLDVLDPATGQLLRSADSLPGDVGVAADREGRVFVIPGRELAARLDRSEREPLEPPFALPRLGGDTLRLADVRGKVMLLNFWASWCDPCREEFPLMIQLYRELPRSDFEIVAISDDADRGAMERFVQEFAPPFPVLVGGGRMKDAYHYRGLPYSLLLDRNGRIVRRIFGFGGPHEFHRLREEIEREIGAR